MNNNPISYADSDGGCTTSGGRPCVFSALGGTATDFEGNIWAQDMDGNLSIFFYRCHNSHVGADQCIDV